LAMRSVYVIAFHPPPLFIRFIALPRTVRVPLLSPNVEIPGVS
jgi:hypothetical protein